MLKPFERPATGLRLGGGVVMLSSAIEHENNFQDMILFENAKRNGKTEKNIQWKPEVLATYPNATVKVKFRKIQFI